MTDRPTEQDLALDAIDDAFKGVISQFTKDRVEGQQIDIAAGVRRALAARKSMIVTVTVSIEGQP